jgi:hypothetical protein
MEEGAAAIAGSGGCQAIGSGSQAGLAARRASCLIAWQHDNGPPAGVRSRGVLHATTPLLHLPANT